MKGGAFALFFSSLSFWFPFQIYKFPRCKAMSVRERDREDVKLKSMSHKGKKNHFQILPSLVMTLQLEKTPMQIQPCKPHLAQENV